MLLVVAVQVQCVVLTIPAQGIREKSNLQGAMADACRGYEVRLCTDRMQPLAFTAAFGKSSLAQVLYVLCVIFVRDVVRWKFV